MFGLGERLDLYTTSERVPGGRAVSALQIAKDGAAGRAFDTRNASDSLRMTNGTTASHLRDVTQVTDSESPYGETITSGNTAEEAFERVSAELGLPKADAETIARREREYASGKGLLCLDCGHEFSPTETIYRKSISHRTLFGWGRTVVSYCESCQPIYWDVDYGKCDTCEREVYFPWDRRIRRHIFCSDRCSRNYYNQRQKEGRLAARQKTCIGCETEFLAPRSDTKFCSAACKQKAYRARQTERQGQ